MQIYDFKEKTTHNRLSLQINADILKEIDCLASLNFKAAHVIMVGLEIFLCGFLVQKFFCFPLQLIFLRV